MTIVSTIASVFTFTVVLVAVLGFFFFVSDKVLDTESKTNIRKQVEEFWFKTASLEFYEQFSLALRSRYMQMRRLRKIFLTAFVLVAVVLALSNAVHAFLQPPEEAFQYYEALSTNDFDSQFEAKFGLMLGVDESGVLSQGLPNFGDVDGQCTKGYGIELLQDVYKLLESRASVHHFLEMHHKNSWSIRLFGGIVGFVDPLLFALPLLVGLFVSLNLTLWLLSRIVQSKLTFLLIVVADIGLAFAMPALLSTVMLTLMLIVVFHFIGSFAHFATFEHPTWITMGLSAIGKYFYNSLIGVVLVAVFTKSPPAWFTVSLTIQLLWSFMKQNIIVFFADIGRVLSFDLAINPHETLINYAIGIDLLFSLFYIVPCFSLVLMRRNQSTRALFLNLVQWVAEHPKGVLSAVEEIFSSVARYLTGIGKR
jgi:hypothetical protein